MLLSSSLFFKNTWSFSGSTEIGPNKQHNEDSIAIDNNHQFAIVCDGVGGNRCGEVASKMACTYLSNALTNKAESSKTELKQIQLKSMLKSCHKYLLEHMQLHKETQGMATTLVLAFRHKKNATIAWAGDSRAYLLRNDKLIQLSQDHSFVAEKVAQGVFTEKEAEEHSLANLITSALGGSTNSLKHIGIETIKLKKNDRLILCTDGVYGYMAQAQLMNAAKISAHALTSQAIDNDTLDNCSAICIDIS
ncbi:PP2C family protein-serine/threonine phosphatase [Thalassotalea crassostreae]|uniref:PP2C family protein-serine/threonine phosphatase n=1 Tax=Thalassotalea crassostreae TaxID=1763536 RepID=UPI0008384913|nr:PP2C family serine/threonine-protein phosphatase [Thalassotalea crassostreae]